MGKRIAMIAYTHYKSDARVRRAAETLAGRGDQVDVMALGEAEGPRRERLGNVTLTGLAVPRYRGGSTLRYLASYAGFFAAAAVRLTAQHLIRRYDVVYVHTMPDLLVLAGLPARLAGAKVVLDVHDTMPELYQSKFALKGEHPLIRGLAWQERMSCAFANRVICVHEPHRQLLASRGVDPDKIRVVLNLPDPAIFGEPRHGLSETNGAPRLVYHGTIAERLGVDLAVRAFAGVVERIPEARLEIYGTGDFAAPLTKLIDELKLGGQVRFDNRRFPVDQVPALVGGASVGVVPNRKDVATEYMLPVKMLEYIYLGIPVVAPRLSAIAHYFDDGAVSYFEPGNVEALAAAMLHLLSSPEVRAAQQAQASTFTKEYAWTRMRDELFAAVDA